jgi:hypothetical protein
MLTLAIRLRLLAFGQLLLRLPEEVTKKGHRNQMPALEVSLGWVEFTPGTLTQTERISRNLNLVSQQHAAG